MSTSLTSYDESQNQTSLSIDVVPDLCPSCNHHITATIFQGFFNTKIRATDPDSELQVMFRCVNPECRDIFIAYYKRFVSASGASNHFIFQFCKPTKCKTAVFSEIIKKISPDFDKIYNEAYAAEQARLGNICGAGYRKSFEFLVKDYLIAKVTTDVEKEHIKKEQLGTCITNRITDTNIKNVSKRAAWLGNDETHYSRKWETKDLQDLKKLIDLTIHWMEAESLTGDLLKDMPEGS